MKKKYFAPQTLSIVMEPATILCSSGNVIRFSGGGTSGTGFIKPN